MVTSTSQLMDSNLVSFANSVDPGLQADIMDCLLYAQLSADARYAPYTRSVSWQGWITHYHRAIRDIGIPSNGSFYPLQIKIRSAGQLRNMRLRTSGAASSPSLQGVLRESLDKMTSSEEVRRAFGPWFSSGSSESFQVVPCEYDGGGSATFLVSGFHMMTMTPVHGPFSWRRLPGEMLVRAEGRSFSFNSEAYAPHRQRIQDHLAERGRLEVVNL